MHIKYEWDEGKRHQNLAKHDVDFDVIVALDWTSALVIEDRRMDYGEPRLRVLGLIGDRVHAVVVTPPGPTRCVSSACARPMRER